MKNSFSFTPEEADLLFSIARKSIYAMLSDKHKLRIDKNEIPPRLKIAMGAFVTIKADGKLRGCIGRFSSRLPLFKTVRDSAFSAAFEDPRFDPVSYDEFDKVELEITVIGPMKKINNISEIVLGKHGIFIKKDCHSGTMLPQVATEHGWTIEEFLGFTSREKAKLGWDGWKEAELYIYEGLVLEEKKT
jgi:AmmeMemoRadiSam system protein A